ncbi:phosphodiester glycosidase family protein [Microlunatus sp. Gsoil 973]|uniref:phosphodiester glycosidase family protein n=1 Tax=Microlunatus sp. Gsoil 973 TaxID=2672569 RepID=UPI0012B4A59D|nr:phosphodiester glycosidase family protein [Microlunatus sp. Gsoil 973]QGN34275.1 hypothetical protein GJV80_17235 [Microlunatus sp. Gsoil 973]
MSNIEARQSENSFRFSRRGLIAGAVATAGLVATNRYAYGDPSDSERAAAPVLTGGTGFERPDYQTTVEGESVEVNRIDLPVAPGIALTTFDTFGRSGWLRVSVLNADLTLPSVDVDLVADKISDPWTLAATADAQRAVAAVNGDYFDITQTNAPIGPEVKNGELRKADIRHATVATVGVDRIARIADLVLDGTITVAGVRCPLAAVNTVALPMDGVAIFTPLWGDASRSLLQGTGPYTELIVKNGTVSGISGKITEEPVPDDGLVVIGTGTGADRLAAARVGDPVAVSYAARTDSPVGLRMALGSGAVLVTNGRPVDFPPSTGNDEPKPRSAIGWPASGDRVLLVAIDGGANFSTGLSFDDTAKLMVRLGADSAFMLDGGGSTEMVARHPGDRKVTVTNTPSDGNERLIADGVGLFGARGSGRLRGLDLRPQADRVVPGLTLTLVAAGYDEAWAPVEVEKVDWSVVPPKLGTVHEGLLHAGQPGAGSLHASSGAAHGRHPIRVIGELDHLMFTDTVITIDTKGSASVGLTGVDADGFGAPVAARDVGLDYDHDVITVAEADDGGLTISGLDVPGGTTTALTATVGSTSTTLTVVVGWVEEPLADFEPEETWTALAARGSATVAYVDATDRPDAPAGNHALQLSYDFTGQPSTSAAYAVAGSPITLPAGAKKLSLWVKGDGKLHWLRAMMSSQGTTNVPFTFATVVDWTGWKQVVGDIPDGFSAPITLTRVYIAETSQTNKNSGALLFDGLTALVGNQPPNDQPPHPDPYVLEQRSAVGTRRWTFAVLSDLHVSAAQGLDSFSGRQAGIALDQAVAAGPDFLLINGDFVDGDDPADFELALGLLEDHVPADLPVYWGPGNHEAGLSASGGLDAFVAATGRPTHQIFDHRGTRVIMLDSHTGDIRTSDWDQIIGLREELDKAAVDPALRSVIVSFHHPLADPTGAGASQLSDQLEAMMIKNWLTDFRERAGKPIALFTGHVHTASVRRDDGLLEVTTPAVGKTPYASPDHGGFFGWMLVGVDPEPGTITAGKPSPQTRTWLQAKVNPVIDKITLTAPAAITVGDSAAVSATGSTTGFGLTFPLRFPASVVWSGSAGLVIIESVADLQKAMSRTGTLAVLDRGSGRLHAVQPGSVQVTVASGGLSRSATVQLVH